MTREQKFKIKGDVKQIRRIKGEFVLPIFIIPKINRSYRVVLNLKNLKELIGYNHLNSFMTEVVII